MENQAITSTPHAPGLIAGLAGVAKNAFGLLLSRIELAALELGELRNHLVELVLVFSIGLVAVWFALAFWTALLVFLAWETMGWKILLVVAAAFTVFALGLFMYARHLIKQGKLALPTTMSELRVDRDALL